jgi:hypothetical protein
MKFIEDGRGQYQEESQAAPAERPARAGRKGSPPRKKSKHTEKAVHGEMGRFANREVQETELLICDRAPQEMKNLP